MKKHTHGNSDVRGQKSEPWELEYGNLFVEAEFKSLNELSPFFKDEGLKKKLKHLEQLAHRLINSFIEKISNP